MGIFPFLLLKTKQIAIHMWPVSSPRDLIGGFPTWLQCKQKVAEPISINLNTQLLWPYGKIK